MDINNPCIGSDFDEFLDEEGILATVNVLALKRMITYQLEEIRSAMGISKVVMAKRMNTQQRQLTQILNADDPVMTLDTLAKAADALNCNVKIEIQPR